MMDHNNQTGFRVPPSDETRRFIEKDESASAMVQLAEKLGKHLSDQKVTTSQIRNAYGSMKKLEMIGWQGPKTQREILLLKPRLAYAAGRQSSNAKTGLEDLRKILSDAIDTVKDQTSFKRFCQFFEAIVAYHKAAGGK